MPMVMDKMAISAMVIIGMIMTVNQFILGVP